MTLSISRKDFAVHPRHKQLNRAENDPFTAVTVLNMSQLPIQITAIELIKVSSSLMQLFKKQKSGETFPLEYEGSMLPVTLEPKDFWDFGYFHSKLPQLESGSLHVNIRYMLGDTEKLQSFHL
ncbi:MAG TPA: hypothetical protein VFM46_19375 [Pseudomonadales bacterium]|nr:hypothetical protein [Pseudomonadales bacterium]